VASASRNVHRLEASVGIATRSGASRHLRCACLRCGSFRSFFFFLATGNGQSEYCKNDSNFLHVYPPFVGWLMVNRQINT